MANYNSTEAFVAQQLQNFANATDANKVLRAAAIDVVPKMIGRIQNQGEKSDGSQIGKYGTKTITGGPIAKRFGEIASKKQIAARMKSHGDTNEFHGYIDFRKALGRQVAFVDLTLTGDMLRSLKPMPTGPNSFGIGFLGPDEFKKAGWMTKKYGPIFNPSNTELQLSLATINKLATQILSK